MRMRRFGVPQDIEGVLLFECSDRSKFATGIIIHVDGGFIAIIEKKSL